MKLKSITKFLHQMQIFIKRDNLVPFPWDDKFNELAIYNSEKSRSIIHTNKHKQRMKILQKEYNDRLKEYCKNNNIEILRNVPD